MGWSIGFDTNWNRDIGYGVPCECDHPECSEEIHRGLAHVCGSEPYGGEYGCGLYLCFEHLLMSKSPSTELIALQRCEACVHDLTKFEPKPDIKEWTDWKMNDESWAQWRKDNGHPEPSARPPA